MLNKIAVYAVAWIIIGLSLLSFFVVGSVCIEVVTRLVGNQPTSFLNALLAMLTATAFHGVVALGLRRLVSGSV